MFLFQLQTVRVCNTSRLWHAKKSGSTNQLYNYYIRGLHACPIWKYLNSKNSSDSQIGLGLRLSSEFFSSNYFQIGQHVILLHTLIVHWFFFFFFHVICMYFALRFTVLFSVFAVIVKPRKRNQNQKKLRAQKRNQRGWLPYLYLEGVTSVFSSK